MKRIIITIKENRTKDLENLAKYLSEAGVEIVNVYPYGVITARADDDLISQLRGHEDIESVGEEKSIQLPSPDEEVQ